MGIVFAGLARNCPKSVGGGFWALYARWYGFRCFGNLFPKRTPSLRSIKGCASCPTLPPRSQKRRKRSGYAVVACPCIDVLPSYGVILAALAGCSYPAWHLFVSGTSSRNTENVILAALAGYPCWRWCLSVSGTSSRNTDRFLGTGLNFWLGYKHQPHFCLPTNHNNR